VYLPASGTNERNACHFNAPTFISCTRALRAWVLCHSTKGLLWQNTLSRI
jgi:hypothetical protein